MVFITDMSSNTNTSASTSAPFPGLPSLLCYDLSGDGYTISKTPNDLNSKFKLDFKVKYQTSDNANDRITLGVVYKIAGDSSYNLLGQDTLLGQALATDNQDIYNFNFVHEPNTANHVEYIMFYQPEGLGGTAVGVIGDVSASNCLVIEDYLPFTAFGGVTGPTGTYGPTGPPALLISYEYKNSNLGTDISDNANTYIDATNYNLSITPSHPSNKIRVVFRNKYITSPQPRTFMNFRIMYDIDGGGYTEFCSDSGLGYNNALAVSPDPVTDIYIVDKIHAPDSSGTITYKLQYYIDASGGDVGTTDISLGVLESSGNSIILEELAFSGTNALPQWTVGDSNSLYYDDGNIGIGKEATQGIVTKDISNTIVLNGPLALDVSGNTRIDGVLDMSNNLIVDVSGIWFNNESYIGAGNSLDITSTEPIKINNTGLIIHGNKVGIGMMPTGTGLFQMSGNFQIDTGSTSKLVFHDSQNAHEHGEIYAEGDGTNGGALKFQTKVDGGAVSEKLRITENGRIGLVGANYGTTGQVLTSNGASAPTWQTLPSADPSVVETDTDATYYPVFVDGAGSGITLRADTTTTPISVNPNTGDFNVVDTLKIDQTSVAVGKSAGLTTQGTNSVAIGLNAGQTTQGATSIAIGLNAGLTTQGTTSVAIGNEAGKDTQGGYSVAVGFNCGRITQGGSSVAIGNRAGETRQGATSIGIGLWSGRQDQEAKAIAIGYLAAQLRQKAEAIAIGSLAADDGYSAAEGGGQGTRAIAIGTEAGKNKQGATSIAIGAFAGRNLQGANSIILNATGAQLNNTGTNRFTVKPVRDFGTESGFKQLYYNPSTGEIAYT